MNREQPSLKPKAKEQSHVVAEWHFGGGWGDLTGREKTKRLAMAQWMMENGSDVHQGGNGPLMRAALFGARIPMMELLVQHGADVNAVWHGEFPIIFSPCETVDPRAEMAVGSRGKSKL